MNMKYGAKCFSTFLSLTKLGLINVISVKVNRSAWVEEMKIPINVKCSRELSAKLNTITATVNKLNAKYAPDNTLREIR